MAGEGTFKASGAAVRANHRADGCIELENAICLPSIKGTIPRRLAYWAVRRPAAVFLSEADRVITYGEAETARHHHAARLLGLGLSEERPLLILGENSINHALLMLAASSVGIPAAIVSPAYVAQASPPWEKLGRVIKQVTPSLIVADQPEAVQQALDALAIAVPVRPVRDFSWIGQIESVPPNMVANAERAVSGDSVAKLLFTSGSTGIPKAVPNTQRMMVSNMLALEPVWPFLRESPPMLVDWLPWNHTFGGNCCFNITLWFGGHLHIDKGRPAQALIGHTVEALRRFNPSVYFNVPLGYELLLGHLEKDHALAARFFQGLHFAFNAGAAMSQAVRMRLEVLWRETTGREPAVVGGWGSTETAPFATVLPFPTPYHANLGIPIPGTTLKLVPLAERERYELRVRGPNVMPGYWRDAAASAAAFDEESFYCIGDVGRFAEANNPSAGIVFDGRVAENFKLSSGTFVNVSALRLAVISAGGKLISDAVIAGEGYSEVGVLLFLNEAACRQFLGTAASPATPFSQEPQLIAHLTELLSVLNKNSQASSARIARFLILDELPSAADDEITDKGYLNQRRILARRSSEVKELYSKGIRLP